MFGTQEVHTETESEDGGVSLLMFESSDEMETNHESAPTSASQSPLYSTTPLDSTTENMIPPTVLDTVQPHAPGVQSMHDVASGEIFLQSASSGNTQEVISHTPPMSPPPLEAESLVQSLSGDFLNSNSFSSSLGEENAADQSSETPAASTSFLDSTFPYPPPPMDEQSIHLPNSSEYLPTLVDVFGSAFLTQTSASPQHHINDALEVDNMQDDYSDFWTDEDGTKNYGCKWLFKHWKDMYAHGIPDYPQISEAAIKVHRDKTRDKVLAEDLDPTNPDVPDFQGIHWSRLQTTKEKAREVRRMTYTNHINDVDEPVYNTSRLVSNSGSFGTKKYIMKFSDKTIPGFDKHFDFRETNMKFMSHISHFQLRHNLFASSKNALFYARKPSRGHSYGAYVDFGHTIDAKINCFNPETSADECVIDFSKRIHRDFPSSFRPSTLNAGNGVLTVGSFEGAYAMKSLSSDFTSKPTLGIITDSVPDGSTNHISSFLDRISGLPKVAFSSNDKTIRILDCTTNKFTGVHHFSYPVNSSATSPDGRLRLLVGDDCSPIVANAETGEVVTKLQGHTNFGFACDWAPDGVNMATGHQDGFVRVWDARNMSESSHCIPMEMAGSRTLQFSPLGSGKRVLVIAEPGDFVHIVDAQTFQSKQVIDFFGEIAGISMPPDGSALYISNQDSAYGGLMEFQRSWGRSAQSGRHFQPKEQPARGVDRGYWTAMEARSDNVKDANRWDGVKRPNDAEEWLRWNTWREPSYDWLPEEELDEHPRVVVSRPLRERRGVGLEMGGLGI